MVTHQLTMEMGEATGRARRDVNEKETRRRCHIDRGADRSDRNDKGGGIHVLSMGWDSGLGPRKQLEALEALARTINQGVKGSFLLCFSCVLAALCSLAPWHLGSLVGNVAPWVP